MKKFRFKNCELMENNIMLKEDGFICNGRIAIKENLTLINKSSNVNYLTLKEMARKLNISLNPSWKSLINVLEINEINIDDLIEVEISDKRNNFFTPIFLKNTELNRRAENAVIDRFSAISPEIKFYSDKYFSKVFVVLNNEIIGLFMAIM